MFYTKHGTVRFIFFALPLPVFAYTTRILRWQAKKHGSGTRIEPADFIMQEQIAQDGSRPLELTPPCSSSDLGPFKVGAPSEKYSCQLPQRSQSRVR